MDAIRQVHEQSAAAVSRAVNTGLTMRNWAIGAYIHHYELNGADRAEYGDGLIDRLAEALERAGVTACDRIRLYLYQNFARTYPQIGGLVCGAELSSLSIVPIVRSLTEQSQNSQKVRSLTEQSETPPIRQSTTAKSKLEGVSEPQDDNLQSII